MQISTISKVFLCSSGFSATVAIATAVAISLFYIIYPHLFLSIKGPILFVFPGISILITASLIALAIYLAKEKKHPDSFESFKKNKKFIQNSAIPSKIDIQERSELEKYSDVLSFASFLLKIESSKLDLKKVQSDLMTGASGDAVYLVYKKGDLNHPLCVIKVLERITSEADAIYLMKRYKTKICRFPNILGIGRLEESNSVLLAQSVAPGQALSEYIKNAGKANGKERKNALNLLKQAIICSSKAMAELHNLEPSHSHTINREEINQKYKDILKDNINFLKDEEVLVDDDLAKLNAATDQMNFSNKLSYVHGDFHPGNLFYQSSSNFCTLIDNDMLMLSVDEESKAPKGIASYDFVYFKQWIAILGNMENLSKEEIKDLQKVFHDTYLKSRKGINIDFTTEIFYMKLFILTKYIQDLSIALNCPEHSWKQSIGNDRMQFFMEELKKELLTELDSRAVEYGPEI